MASTPIARTCARSWTPCAALPGLGPVTVQARTTLVSLVTPRRTFAVVQATTKNRVDFGLRLDDVPPGGRLLAARDIGAATRNPAARAITTFTSP